MRTDKTEKEDNSNIDVIEVLANKIMFIYGQRLAKNESKK